MDMEVIQQLLIKLSEIVSSNEGKPIVIFSEGKHFSRGYDCSCHLVKDNQFLENVVTIGTTIGQLIRNYDHPVVAYAHGYALGAGLELLLLCDYAVAGADFNAGLPETLFNFPNLLIPPELMGKYLPKNGVNTIVSGAILNSKEALGLGIVNQTGLLEDARKIARSMNTDLLSMSKSSYMMDQKEIKNYLNYIRNLDTRLVKLRELEDYRKTHFV